LVAGAPGIFRRLFKKAVQQGRSKRGGEAYFLPYVEPLSEARTPLADFFNSLLDSLRFSNDHKPERASGHRRVKRVTGDENQGWLVAVHRNQGAPVIDDATLADAERLEASASGLQHESVAERKVFEKGKVCIAVAGENGRPA
jgi:hypothetical protein